MIYAQIDKCRFAVLLIFLLFCMGVTVDLCNAGEGGTEDSALGELKLEGKHVDYLVLRGRDGHTERFTHPEEIIELPPGEYLLGEAHLKGGYIRHRIAGDEPITVRQGEQQVLKVGAPLVPTLKVQRQGRVLVMSCELLGAGGETYTSSDRSKPPTFAVYKGQKKIASGKFEFG